MNVSRPLKQNLVQSLTLIGCHYVPPYLLTHVLATSDLAQFFEMHCQVACFIICMHQAQTGRDYSSNPVVKTVLALCVFSSMHKAREAFINIKSRRSLSLQALQVRRDRDGLPGVRECRR